MNYQVKHTTVYQGGHDKDPGYRCTTIGRPGSTREYHFFSNPDGSNVRKIETRQSSLESFRKVTIKAADKRVPEFTQVLADYLLAMLPVVEAPAPEEEVEICPHCDVSNAPEYIRCIHCGRSPDDSVVPLGDLQSLHDRLAGNDLGRRLVIRMAEVDAGVTCSKYNGGNDRDDRAPDGDDYNDLWDAVLDELQDAAEMSAIMLAALERALPALKAVQAQDLANDLDDEGDVAAVEAAIALAKGETK